MGKLETRKGFIRGNTILMVLLAINYAAMKMNVIEARHGGHDPDRGGQLDSDEDQKPSNAFN